MASNGSSPKALDVLIVGAGAIGLGCAWRAAQRGLRVRVLDRGEPGSGASGVAAGMLAPVGEVAYGEAELLEASLAAARAWPEFATEVEAASGRTIGYRPDGALHVALDRDEAEALQRHHDFQRSLGLDAEWLTPSECRALEPGITPHCAGGVHAREEASVDPRALCAALQVAAEAAGAEVVGGAEVTEALIEGAAIRGVRTADGAAHAAERVVLAAGAWSGAAGWLPEAARPPVRPVKGEMLVLRALDGALPCAGIVASERVYLVPRAGGRLIVGATVEERGFDTTVTAGGVHELLREAYRLLPDIAELELEEARAGLRPGTPDNLPIVGPGALDGLLLATGHYRNGILLTPTTADAIADLLTREPAAR